MDAEQTINNTEFYSLFNHFLWLSARPIHQLFLPSICLATIGIIFCSGALSFCLALLLSDQAKLAIISKENNKVKSTKPFLLCCKIFFLWNSIEQSL